MVDKYIRKQDAIYALDKEYRYGADIDRCGLAKAFKAIESLEPADVAPVVHARWIKPTGMMPPEYHGHYECSACGTWAGRDWLRPWKEILLSDWCPGCGAKMEKTECPT